jgi:PAS domain S-box-containing protein
LSTAPDYHDILNLLPVGVCFVDPQTSAILLANDAAACILDVTAAQDLVGRSVLQLVQRRRRREVRNYLRHVAQTAPRPSFFHERLDLKTGRQIDLEIAAGILNLGGRSVVQLAFRDITDQTSAEAALRESEALFRRLAETTEAAIFLFRGSHIIHVNPAACRITGRDYEELVAMPFWQVLHPDFRDLVREHGLARQGGEAVVSSYEVAILTKSGETRWLQYAGNVFDYQGQPAVLGTAIDITARKEIEQALQESEARFRTLAQVSPANITVHVDDHLIYANPATIKQTGYSEEELKAIDFWTLLRPDSLKTMQQASERMGRRETVSGLKLQIATKDGSTRWMEVNLSPFDQQGKTAWVVTGYDITTLVEAEQVLRNYARRLEELSRRLVQVQEIERRSIARELHDEVGQTLTALSIHLELASRTGSEELVQRLAETQRLVDDLTDRVRRMSLDLRPPMLDDLGLLPALLWYFERIAQQYRLQVAFEHHGIERRFDADVETAIFRIVQEALTNVARHAQVQIASVRLWADTAAISAQIEDKGQGFDPDLVLGRNITNGLRGMQERVRLLAGKLVIEAQPGGGVCLTALLPLPGTRHVELRGPLV